ncbi:Uncharacterised protein [Bordetella pertussis]|nr:Uncharacterised protein [Bordetella pertussis]
MRKPWVISVRPSVLNSATPAKKGRSAQTGVVQNQATATALHTSWPATM